MVESQIRTNQGDRSAPAGGDVAAMPRQIFVPEPRWPESPMSIRACGIVPNRYLLEPLVLARLLQEAMVGPTDKVLVIGAGTGYSTAHAGRAGGIRDRAGKRRGELAEKARANLAALAVSPMRPSSTPARWRQGYAASAPLRRDPDRRHGGRAAARDRRTDRRSWPAGDDSVAGRPCAAPVCCIASWPASVSGRVLFDATGPFLPGMAPRPPSRCEIMTEPFEIDTQTLKERLDGDNPPVGARRPRAMGA